MPSAERAAPYSDTAGLVAVGAGQKGEARSCVTPLSRRAIHAGF